MPYVIEFRNEIRHYGCKKCGNQLFHNDNFGDAINNWLNKKTLNMHIKPNYNNVIPLILTNNVEQNITDVDINKRLLSFYTNEEDTVFPKYIICKGVPWDTMNFGKIITPKLDEQRNIEEYVYIYTYQKLYRHLSRVMHVRHKLHNAEQYINNCVPVYKFLSEKQIDYYYKKLDINAVTIFLWRRDMEHSSFSKCKYYMNKTKACYYRFDPDYGIIEYIRKINEMLPNEIESSYRFNILVHVVMKLMYEQYIVWKKFITSLIQNYNDKIEQLKILNEISFRRYWDQHNSELLLTMDIKDNIYKIYFSTDI